jgi:hypothetical protein
VGGDYGVKPKFVQLFLLVVAFVVFFVAVNSWTDTENGGRLGFEAVEGSIGASRADFILRNPTDYDVYYGAYYALERFVGDEWVRMRDNGLQFHDGEYRLEPGSSHIFTIEWAHGYGELTPGKYRIIKGFGGILLSAEFEVK